MLFVALHGFGGSGGEFDPLVARLQPPKVWTPDLLVDGPLSPHHTFAEWTENFVHQLLDQARGEPIEALGYSMGGRLLLHAVVRYPELFRRVIIVSADPGLSRAADPAPRRQWECKWAERFQHDRWAQVWEDWNSLEVFSGSLRRSAPEERRSQRELLARALIHWSPTRHLITESEVAALKMPILWVAGERDRKYAELYRQGQANGTLGQVQILPGAGHRVHQDMPDPFAEVVSAFFQS